MSRARHLRSPIASALLFGGWTLFVWVGRLRNLAAEPGSMLEANRWSLVGSVGFTVLGLAVVGAAIVWWTGRSERPLGPAVLALTGLTVPVWIVRAVDIAAGDHSAGFVAVHLVLAVVSIGLAGAASIGWYRAAATGAGSESDSDLAEPSETAFGYARSDG